jgi:hypothetical protein
LTSRQEKFVKKLADFLSTSESSSIIIHPQMYEAKEKEYILFFEAKKKFYLACNQEKATDFDKSDSEYVDKMSVKDSSFVRYLNKHKTKNLLFTIQDKCSNIVNPGLINSKYSQLIKEREAVFMSYFKEKKVENKVKFEPVQNSIPYNGFSLFKIEYKGELPGYLIKAYKKMDELNEEAPREKYESIRKTIKSI